MELMPSTRYRCHDLNNLVGQLDTQANAFALSKIKAIEQDRKVHRSCIQIAKSSLEGRRLFNNRTKEGGLFNEKPQQIPYLFIPKYMNDTFIMPNRVFEKGNSAKRFHIKMKDTSITSFKDPEADKMQDFLHRRDKDRTISGRKMEELNRILDENDGKLKAKTYTRLQKTRKTFNPTKTNSDLFSEVSPMLEPKDKEIVELKKICLAKTFGPNAWKPATRAISQARTTHLNLSNTSDFPSSMTERC